MTPERDIIDRAIATLGPPHIPQPNRMDGSPMWHENCAICNAVMASMEPERPTVWQRFKDFFEIPG